MHRACEEPNHALICYRRADATFAEALRDRLKERYIIDCFRDDEGHKYGAEWRPCWRQQLDFPAHPLLATDIGPTVIILATDAALQPRPGQDIVVEEIWEALTPSDPDRFNPLVILRFGSRGWQELLVRLAKKAQGEGRLDLIAKLSGLHEPGAFDPALLRTNLTDRQWDQICRPIVVSVRSYFLRKMLAERQRAKDWAKDILNRRLVQRQDDDFTKYQSSRRNLDEAISALALSNKKAVVAVAEGGMGKTTQVAQSLLSALDNETPAFFPMIMTSEDVDDIDGTLRDRLGLRWLEAGRPVSLTDEGLHWFKDKLCFVTDSLERADDVAATARQLDRLRPIAKVLITSRPEAWLRAKEQLSVSDADLVRLDAISENDVAKYVGIGDLEDVHKRRYLCNPVFLDVAAYLVRQKIGIRFEDTRLSSETDLLDEFKRFSVEPQRGRVASEIELARKDHERFLMSLAHLQLDEHRFDVKLSALRAAGYSSAIEYLTFERPYAIIEGPDEASKRIRLRHDVIDSHNLADLITRIEPDLFSQALGVPGAGSVGKLHIGFGQIMFEGVVQAAYDRGHYDRRQAALIREFFLEFLRLVDNKGQPDTTFKAAGWNSGYVISARLRIFTDLIKQSLAGDYLGEAIPPSKAERLSGLDRLTQKAMSSVGSMLGGQRSMSVADPDGSLLRALANHIADPKVSLKGRLIEGIAKIDRPDDVVKLLADLAGSASLINNDPGSVRYIARALNDAARGAREHIGAFDKALKRLKATFQAAFPGRFPSIHRDIEEAEHTLADLSGLSVPTETPVTPEEFVEGLSNHDPTLPGQYSDWIIIERYLGILERPERRQAGPPAEPIIMVVGRCLWHHHSRCHEKAARTLGFIDHPFARGLLLHVLTFESGDGTETEIIQALSRQGQHLLKTSPDRARRFRLALLRALAARHRLIGDQRADELTKLLGLFTGYSNTLVTEQFIELRRFSHALPMVVEDRRAVSPDLPAWLSDAERQRDVGEEKEAKVAFQALPADDAQPLRFIRSSWKQPRRFHAALLDRADYFRRMAVARERPADLAPNWEVESADWPQSERTKRAVELGVSFRPGWKDCESRAFAAYLEAIAERHASLESATAVPSIATLHCVVILADGNLIEAKRADDSVYAPGSWAASFEEQMKLEDIGSGDGLVTCCLRGLHEEFGVALTKQEIVIEAASLGVEWQLLNTAVLVTARLALDTAAFLQRRAAGISDGEVDPPTYEPLLLRLGKLERSVFGTWYDKDRRPTHPTSCARLALASEAASKL